MARKFRHTKSGFVVEHNGYGRYENTTSCLALAPTMVEESSDWEEVVPLFDDKGFELKDNDLFYTVHLLDNGITMVVNGRGNGTKAPSKIIAVYRDYKEATQYEKVYNTLRKIQGCVATSAGLPSAYFKKILKQLVENKK